MKKSLSVLLFAVLTLSACSNWRNSGANPSNWFGPSSTSETEVSATDANALVPEQSETNSIFRRPVEDNSVPITKIDELRIEPTPAGAIIYATGTAERQGAFNAKLVRVKSEENAQNGILEYTFRVDYPETATQQGPERTRMVSDATNVSLKDLKDVRLVRVVGQQNALESRRR